MAIKLSEQQCQNLDLAMRREWLLTNGLGGFAMGTPSGINTRRYHGLLVAAVRPPTYRMVLLASMDAFIQTDGNPVGLSANQYPGAIYPDGYLYLRGFSVEPNVAVWRYKTAEAEIERKLIMHAGHNAITISYRNLGSRSVLLTLRPLVCHKFYHSNFGASGDYPQRLDYSKASTLVSHDGMDLTIGHPGARRSPVQGWYYRFEHVREAERGLDSRDDLYCPCELAYELAPGEQAIVTASDERETKPAESESSVAPRGSLADQLREAAGQFLVQTPARTSIISGYPWFTDWGRDTMVAIPGICLHTGRFAEARAIIDAFIGAMSEGLIPNRFVEEGEAPDNNTVDATLWMANALHRTLEAEWDEPFARRCLDALREVLAWHLKGTMHGIRVDPEDGLLTQGEPGLQLTWMDAKVGEWVVTPRHGKPVEVNGLW
ncbi:MAG: glycogen debranching enzyme N-terminal domain-containing protein, partial [Fimbriimonas ginsengisoli]|nr:glycogen debranching enzyme N-terminal domain-containing protein [Fimbriimonas ginsengisoli]